MPTVTPSTQDVYQPPSTRTLVGFWWILLSAVAIAVFAPLPYVTDSLRGLAANDSQVAANYVDRAPWLQAAFYAHVTFGGLALLLSPLQFAARIRQRAPRVHRIIGRTVLVCIGLAGTAGLILAPHSLAGAIGTAGFGALAALWLGFAATAFVAIRRGEVERHRLWVTRTFALTYAAVTLRLWLGVLITAQIAGGGVDADVAFDRAYHIVPFLCWVPNLLVAELLLRARARRLATGTGAALA
jgi:uncharacterized membrane protein